MNHYDCIGGCVNSFLKSVRECLVGNYNGRTEVPNGVINFGFRFEVLPLEVLEPFCRGVVAEVNWFAARDLCSHAGEVCVCGVKGVSET